MNTNRSTILIGLFLLIKLTTFAQVGADPAVTNRDLQPAPVAGVGSPFSLTFTIGNNGTVPISGNGSPNQMKWSICLGKCAPSTADPIAALSGPLLTYFDAVFTPPTSTTNNGCYEGTQKQGVALIPITVYNLVISAVVTKASTSTVVNDIGAACRVTSPSSVTSQPGDNDFAAIYTHTTTVAMPVSLTDFTAQAQADRTVLVTWKTAWERTNKGYVVERSKDLKEYELVGEVNDVVGSSNSQNSYRFVDKNPYRGTSYYRLRQVDLDGENQTFEAKPVVIDGQYGVYPNPIVNHGFTLELDEPVSAIVHLYSASGSEITINMSVLTEVSTKVVPSAKLTSGVYILTVQERGTTRKHRLVVQ